MIRKFPRDILNKLKWTGEDLSKVKIRFINRGSPNDIAIREGGIKEIGSAFLVFFGVPQDTWIPYHRIKNIEYNGEVLFER